MKQDNREQRQRVEKLCDSQEGKVKENICNKIKIIIYINFLLCKWAIWAWYIISGHYKFQID